MSASTLTSARPPHAAIAWATKDALYVEIPHKLPGNPPFIVRYRKSTDGLAQALNILLEHADAPYTRPPVDPNAAHPAIKRAKLSAPNASEDQREAARRALAKIGIL